MQRIHAIALIENVNDWLVDSGQPRILHVFDEVCNLINEGRDVLPVVTTKIGNGPLTLVVEDGLSFSEQQQCYSMNSSMRSFLLYRSEYKLH